MKQSPRQKLTQPNRARLTPRERAVHRPPGGNPAFGRPWTTAEDDVVRRLYDQGSAAVARELPGRTREAIQARARLALGLARHNWPVRDDVALRSLWGSLTLSALAERFGRTEQAVFSRSRSLRLSRLPQGMEWLTTAAKRTGYDIRTLRNVLDAANVRPLAALSIRKHGKRERGWQRSFVDPFDVNEAVKKWLETETVASAAARRGVSPERLRRALLGVPGAPRRPGRLKCWRVPSEVIDRAVASAERKAA